MTYKEQLESEEWQELRKEIIERDGLACKSCENGNLTKDCEGEIVYRVDLPNNDKVDAFDCMDLRRGFAPKSVKPYRGYFGYFNKENNEKLELILGINKKEEEYQISLEINKERYKEFRKHFPTPQAWHEFLWKSNETKKLDKELARANRKKYYGGNPKRMVLNPSEYEKYKEDRKKKKNVFLFVRGLHVHHKYYQLNKLAWEYPKESLITLCWICHENLHKDEVVDVLDEEGKVVKKYSPCQRCFGAGMFPEFRHVESGICFRCNGAKYEELI